MSVPTSEDVLDAVRAEIARPDHGTGHLRARLQSVQWSIDKFRAEPVGGRLRPLKAFVFWFVASAFDRQTKILEEMAALIGEVLDEMDDSTGAADGEDESSGDDDRAT